MKDQEKVITTDSVKVFVRCRPIQIPRFNSNEGGIALARVSHRRSINYVNNDHISVLIGDKKFTFDYIFDEDSLQSELYTHCIKGFIKGCFEGYNATIFAYGQTGSGKTHSMMGRSQNIDDEGIIPRAIRDIFLHVEMKTKEINDQELEENSISTSSFVCSFKVSFIEIYNEELKDLLHLEISPKDIIIREDKEGRIFYTGAREEDVVDVTDALYFLEKGNINRTTAETFMNTTSSRSHAIFSVSIEIFEYNDNNSTSTKQGTKIEKGTFIQSKLHFVDLAGSERAKRTGAAGTRLKESVGINQGLLSLGKVIRALTVTAPKIGQQVNHIPYRESKLTRFLQDSLGGNSKTIMLACISPSESNFHETLSTLQYAARAKGIENKISAHNITIDADKFKNGLNNNGEDEFVDNGREFGIVFKLREQIISLEKEMKELKNREIGNITPSNITNILNKSITRLSTTKSLSDLVLRSNLNSNINSENTLLKQEIEECREDLKRDEEIFREKIKELKVARKLVKQYQNEKEIMESKIESLEIRLEHAIDNRNYNKDNELIEGDNEGSFSLNDTINDKSFEFKLNFIVQDGEIVVDKNMNEDKVILLRKSYEDNKNIEWLTNKINFLASINIESDLSKELLKRCNRFKSERDELIKEYETVEIELIASEYKENNNDEYRLDIIKEEIDTINTEIQLSETIYKSKLDKIKYIKKKILNSKSFKWNKSNLKEENNLFDINPEITSFTTELNNFINNYDHDSSMNNKISINIFNYLTQMIIAIMSRTQKDDILMQDLRKELDSLLGEKEDLSILNRKQQEIFNRQALEKKELEEQNSFLLFQLSESEKNVFSVRTSQDSLYNSIELITAIKKNKINIEDKFKEEANEHVISKNYQEILNKWKSEKVRREKLEECNRELVSELRHLRKK
jgi:kinesin family protein 4/21/27